MAFCPNCGAPAEGRYCARCGSMLPGAADSGEPRPPTAAAGGLTDNLAGALCYLLGLFTGILFLLLPPYNQKRFVRFHAFQAIFSHIAFIAIWIVESMILSALPWSLSLVGSLLALAIGLGGLAVWLLLLYKAYQGEKFKLPVIGDLAEQQA